MRKAKKLVTGLMCFSMVLGLTSCATTSVTQDSSVSTTEDAFDASNTVDVDDISLDAGDADISGAVINYIGVYDPTKAADIKPAYVYFKNNYGATMEVELVSDADIMDKLGTYISSGTSPDLVDKRDNSFPYWISKNMYEPLDDYMDLTAPQWSDVATYIDSYAVNGKHYYYPFAYYVNPYFLIYNRAKFEELGIDDPKTLYDNGNWTWDTFYSCMTDFVSKSQNDIPDAIGLYGVVSTTFINSTGGSLISYDGDKLVNNMRSTQVEDAMSYMENIKKEGLSAVVYKDYSNVDAQPIVSGCAAFQCMGDWKISDYAKLQSADDTLDFFFVPIPRDPNADEYYYNLNTFGYFVPSGAKDIQAATIFMNCVRLSKTDSELAEKTEASIIKGKAYTDEQYEFWSYFQDSSNFNSNQLITDFAYSLDSTTTTDIMPKILEDTALVADADSWTTMREQYYSVVDDSINSLNEVLSE